MGCPSLMMSPRRRDPFAAHFLRRMTVRIFRSDRHYDDARANYA
jgi:hypothetical protein